MRRIGGLGAVVAVLAVGGFQAPAAPAAGAAMGAFTGTATTSTGYWAPCATVDAAHRCPPQVVLTPPPTGKMAPPFTPYGDLGGASFTSSTCVGPGATACTLTLGFSMHGYCGLSSGRGTGGFVDSAGAAHHLAFTYTVVGGVFTGRGAATLVSTGEVGDILLAGAFLPTDPDACQDGSASSFTFTGDLTLAYPKLTP